MKKKTSAFSLAELTVAMGVAVLATGAAFSGSLTMQRCLAAGEEFAADKTEQTRLSDYLALDLRRALTVQGPPGNVILSVTIPDFYGADGNPRTPTVIRAADSTYVAQYTPSTIPVVYRKYGSTVTRTEGAADPVVIAENVADFSCAVNGIGTGKVVQTQISFVPSFQRNGTVSDATKAATTLYSSVRLRNK
jgi:hypothetical protein